MKVLFPLVFLVFSLTSFAQTKTNELGIHIGTMNYQGELSESINYNHLSPTFGVFFRQNWNDALSSRYSIAYGKIKDDDKNAEQLFQQIRAHSFETSIIEVAAQLEYNFYSFRKPRVKSTGIHATPYVFAGLAGFRMSPGTDLKGKSQNKISVAIPMGVGIKVKVSEYINVGLDLGPRLTFTDNLDALNPNTGYTKYHEGNPHDKDWYFTTHLTFSYVFPASLCPKF